MTASKKETPRTGLATVSFDNFPPDFRSCATREFAIACSGF
jgi:hypothetical protein